MTNSFTWYAQYQTARLSLLLWWRITSSHQTFLIPAHDHYNVITTAQLKKYDDEFTRMAKAIEDSWSKQKNVGENLYGKAVTFSPLKALLDDEIFGTVKTIITQQGLTFRQVVHKITYTRTCGGVKPPVETAMIVQLKKKIENLQKMIDSKAFQWPKKGLSETNKKDNLQDT